MTNFPPVTLIVLNWNTARYLPGCLDALLALDYPNYSITVVDNQSSDDSVSLIETQYPNINLIKNPHNRGFSAGNNSGIRAAETPVVVLVNPDVELHPDALRYLVTPMRTDEAIGLVGGKLLYPNGDVQFLGGAITQPQAFPMHFTEPGPETADYIIGALMAIRREVFDAIGLFDEGYFLYYEDADFCQRARRAGFTITLAPNAIGVHHESAATDRRSDFYWEMMFLHRWRYLLKHQPEKALLYDTLPAERAWGATLTGRQRHLLARTYRRVLLRFPEIAAKRIEHGAPPLSNEATAVLQDTFVGMRTALLYSDQPDMDALSKKAFVKEQPSFSKNGLLAWLQAQWVNVATKWYVRPQVQQQNQFNLAAVARLREQAARLMAQEQAHTDYAKDIARLTVELRRMNERLDELGSRLHQVEKGDSRE